MFWRLGFQQSPIEAILERENFTLEELLEEDDIIQECKAINRKLIAFLSTPDVVDKLLTYATEEPDPDADAKVRLKFPLVASELLITDLQSIYDCIFLHEAVCDHLFAFFDGTGVANPMLAGNFCKIVTALISRKPAETFEVFQKKDVLGSCLKNLGTYSMVEIVLRVVAEIEDSTSTLEHHRVEWLFESNMMMQLLERLDEAHDSETHQNVAACLTGILKMSSRVTPSPFVLRLASAECVNKLLDKVFAGSSSALMAGLNVLVELLRTNPATPGADPSDTNPLVAQVLLRLGDFVKLLNTPPEVERIVNTAETLDPPLGPNRLMVVEVLLAMVSLRDAKIDQTMVELDVVPACLALFRQYEWNTLLHNHIKDMLVNIFMDTESTMRLALVKDTQILQWVLDLKAVNEETVTSRGTRVGYAAQLVVIANTIDAVAQETPEVAAIVSAHPGWADYMRTEIEPRNELERHQLGGHRPVAMNTDDDDDLVCRSSLCVVEFRQMRQPEGAEGSGGEGDGWKPRAYWLSETGDGAGEDKPEDSEDEAAPADKAGGDVMEEGATP
mmetsp:Transcript_30234/g.65343  ORF Transcript_30234/g.65343 Transcript_30234/m.65343 type:complete len:559 (-) Transcript_30234:213-1889(-)